MSYPLAVMTDTLETVPGRPYWPQRKPYEVRTLVVHHTATHRALSPKDIHEIQIKRNFGTAEKPLFAPRTTYHGLIDPTGHQWKVNNYSSVGWNAPGANRSGIHLCLIGNFMQHEVPFDQYRSLLEWLAKLMRPVNDGGYGLRIDRVYRHGDIVNTFCPGHYFPSTTRLRDDLAHTLGSAPT